MSDALVRDVLGRARRIAVVGYSANPARPSHRIARFLASQGYEVVPVNPGLAGQEALGQRVAGSLAEIRDGVDVVDVFRQPEAVAGLVDEMLAMRPRPWGLWLQPGTVDPAAAGRARAAGLLVVEGRCPLVEIPRLGIARAA